MANRHRKPEPKPVLETTVAVATKSRSGKDAIYQVELIVLSNAGDKITGTMKAGGKKFRFCWKKSKFPMPWVGVKKGEDWKKAQAFAGKVMSAWATDVLSDCGGSSPSSDNPDPNYVTQLINEGHVRRPCVVRHGDGTTYLRRGTVVNVEKLEHNEAQACRKIVGTWNALLELFRGQYGDPVDFQEWFAKQYGDQK